MTADDSINEELSAQLWQMIDEGRTREAQVRLAQLDSRGTPARVEDADVLAARLWKAWLTKVHDAEAIELAGPLLTPDSAEGTVSRARLGLWFAISLLYGPHAGTIDTLEAADQHLRAAAATASRVGASGIASEALVWRAMISFVADDAAGTAESVRSARSYAEPVGIGNARGEFWRFICTALDEWSRYFLGGDVDERALDEVQSGLVAYGFDPLARIVASTALMVRATRALDLATARGIARRMVSDPEVAALGRWRLRILYADGFLAVVTGDRQRVQEMLDELVSEQAQGEAALLRATQCMADAQASTALATLAPVVEGRLAVAQTGYSVACALQAVLLERLGDGPAADAALRRALANAQPLQARRIFASLDLPMMERLTARAAADPFSSRFVREVASVVASDRAHFFGGELNRPSGSAEQPSTKDPASSASPADAGPPSPLTPRELEVLALVSRGASHQQIAATLFVSLNTVKTHLRSIRTKLGAERTSEAAALARAAGWLRR